MSDTDSSQLEELQSEYNRHSKVCDPTRARIVANRYTARRKRQLALEATVRELRTAKKIMNLQ